MRRRFRTLGRRKRCEEDGTGAEALAGVEFVGVPVHTVVIMERVFIMRHKALPWLLAPSLDGIIIYGPIDTIKFGGFGQRSGKGYIYDIYRIPPSPVPS